MSRIIDQSGRYDVRCGRWQDVLAGETCDLLLADLPFGKKTHDGHNAVKNLKRRNTKKARDLTKIDYDYITEADVHEFVASWSPRVRGWIVVLTSHDMWATFAEAFEKAGRMYFPPIPCIISGMTCRMAGDGPSSETVFAAAGVMPAFVETQLEKDGVSWAMVARPRTMEMVRWGTLPGWYLVNRAGNAETEVGGGRGKPLDLIRRLVHDYSRIGDVVADSHAGFMSTGKAAIGMGRKFLGAEVKPEVFALGAAGLALVPPALELYDPRKATQVGLF